MPGMENKRKITSLDRSGCQTVQELLEPVLAEFAKTLGLVVSPTRGTFSGDNVKLSFTVSLVGEGGLVLTREASDFKANAGHAWDMLERFEAKHLGARFTLGGRTFRIIGYKTRARKLPIIGEEIIGENPTGRSFKFGANAVANAMKLPTEEQVRKVAEAAPFLMPGVTPALSKKSLLKGGA